MIQVEAVCHYAARALARAKNGGRQVYLVGVWFSEGRLNRRFVFRTQMAGGCS